MLSLGDLPLSRDDALVYPPSLRARNISPLWSILLRVSSLITGEDLQTDQVRDEDVFFVTETRRVAVDTGTLPSITPRFNLKTAMIPVGAIHRRARRMVCRLTGGRGVDMKDESHKVCAFSSQEYCPWCPSYTIRSRGSPQRRKKARTLQSPLAHLPRIHISEKRELFFVTLLTHVCLLPCPPSGAQEAINQIAADHAPLPGVFSALP